MQFHYCCLGLYTTACPQADVVGRAQVDWVGVAQCRNQVVLTSVDPLESLTHCGGSGDGCPGAHLWRDHYIVGSMPTPFHNFDTKVYHMFVSASDVCQIFGSNHTYDQLGFVYDATHAIGFQIVQHYSWLLDS